MQFTLEPSAPFTLKHLKRVYAYREAILRVCGLTMPSI